MRGRAVSGERLAPRPRAAGHAAVAGHLGEFIQGRLGPSGPLALVTLPCPALGAEAEWRPAPSISLRAGPASPLPPARAAALLRALDAPGALSLRWRGSPGGGAGLSTAALLAAARAALHARRRPEPSPEALAAHLLRLEGAVDPLMLARPAVALWAPREGRVVERLPPPPRFVVVGGFAGPGRRTDPADRRFPDVADLAAAWAPAAAAGDSARLAVLASESARRCVALRGGPSPVPLEALSERFGALGFALAHTGSARALLFAPGRGDPAGAVQALRALGLSGVLRFETP